MAIIIITIVVVFIGIMLASLFAITAIMYDSDINDVD